MTADLTRDLNDEQREAAEAIRGPVCILAGAGSGKTTTLTRRIAVQIASEAFAPRDILALTFTNRAAAELRERLHKLGIKGDIRARTFHSEALYQVSYFREPPEILPSKFPLVGPLVRRLPKPYRFKAAKDVISEIEWARNRRITPETYLEAAEGRQTVLPPEIMAGVFRAYEERKARANKADFEDVLELAIRLLQDDPEAASRIRARYGTFSVDEYQDTNLLQQTLLDAWLADRDEVCVVGDDYQSIYGFTGATPRYLVDFTRRFPHARTITLDRNYRSTPQVLEVANRLAPALEGMRKILRPVLDPGPAACFAEHATGTDEADVIAGEIGQLNGQGIPLEEMAVLYRINARSDDYEEALAAAGIPYQVRDGAFLRRPGPQAALRLLARADARVPAAETVRKVAGGLGWNPEAELETADTDEEATRLADLARLVQLASSSAMDVAGFIEDLEGRFGEAASGRGVVLSTYHRAKGLEWDVVFLPRLEEREMPFALSKDDESVAEERRLLYVGITRARRHLYLSWARARDGRTVRPSRFLLDIRDGGSPPSPAKSSRTDGKRESSDPDLFERLRSWRKQTADSQDVPAFVVFSDKTLHEICDRKPRDLSELSLVSGVGPSKLERFGQSVLEIVGWSAG